MGTAIWITGLASAAFFVSHLGLSSVAVRGGLVGRLGEKGFQGLYALVALLALGAMIAGYIQASHTVFLWLPGHGLRHLPLLIMPLALILIAGGVLAPNPSAVGMTGALDQVEPAQGVLRITRHPVMWGIGLWAAAHILANGDLASLLFFGGFLLTALGGAWHLDHRMAVDQGERWRRFAAITSYLPFAALLGGRQRWSWAELRRPAAWGLGAFGLLLVLHPYLFGVRPYWPALVSSSNERCPSRQRSCPAGVELNTGQKNAAGCPAASSLGGNQPKPQEESAPFHAWREALAAGVGRTCSLLLFFIGSN